MKAAWNTVVETNPYLARATKILSEAERADVSAMLAQNPECGDIIQGTGGLRKVRIGVDGRGKRGGARVIYYYYDAAMPLFLLEIFAKNEESDLSADDRRRMVQVTAAIRRQHGRE